jgi:hypothetical protein
MGRDMKTGKEMERQCSRQGTPNFNLAVPEKLSLTQGWSLTDLSQALAV